MNIIRSFPEFPERNWTDSGLKNKIVKKTHRRPLTEKNTLCMKQSNARGQMETAMRAQREKVKLLEAGGADPDEVMLPKGKISGTVE